MTDARKQDGPEPKPALWKTLAAFAIIYVVFGSTFVAIRIGVQVLPPFLMAALRFTLAGPLMLLYAKGRGERWPTREQWRSLTLLAVLMFVMDFGLLFWAEQRIASGIAAVLMATIPSFMVLAEIVLLRTQRMSWRLGGALLLGLAGVAALMMPAHLLGGVPVNHAAAIAVLVGGVCWSVASVLSKRLPLPASKALSSGLEMSLGGSMLLVISAAAGELRGFHPGAVTPLAWWALAYLVLAGSVLGFTAYVWLLHHQTPTLVGTYAYVNPVVAVALGAVFLHEPLTARTLVGGLCVLGSVIAMTLSRRPEPA